MWYVIYMMSLLVCVNILIVKIIDKFLKGGILDFECIACALQNRITEYYITELQNTKLHCLLITHTGNCKYFQAVEFIKLEYADQKIMSKVSECWSTANTE